MRPNQSYILCGTPRTGSTFLCALLKSSGVAGIPESYFRGPDEPAWAARWGVPPAADGPFDEADYMWAASNAGRTENGVFGARVMWGSMEPLVEKLKIVYPDGGSQPLTLLEGAFGNTRFVHLRRENVLAQAISWLRAEQTDVWHRSASVSSPLQAYAPRFDYGQLRRYSALIEAHNEAWDAWFTEADIRPYALTYEELDNDPVGTIQALLGFLGLQVPAGVEIFASTRRLADRITVEWMERYTAIEAGERP